MLNNDLLAKALKVEKFTEEDAKRAQEIFENTLWMCSINEAYEEIRAQKILKRITELVEKVEKL